MKAIPAFETPDKKRFFDENEARNHERRYDYGNLINAATRSNGQFVKLDRELLLDFLMANGSTVGKIADSPILPEHFIYDDAAKKIAAAQRYPQGGLVGERPSESTRPRMTDLDVRMVFKEPFKPMSEIGERVKADLEKAQQRPLRPGTNPVATHVVETPAKTGLTDRENVILAAQPDDFDGFDEALKVALEQSATGAT